MTVQELLGKLTILPGNLVICVPAEDYGEDEVLGVKVLEERRKKQRPEGVKCIPRPFVLLETEASGTSKLRHMRFSLRKSRSSGGQW